MSGNRNAPSHAGVSLRLSTSADCPRRPTKTEPGQSHGFSLPRGVTVPPLDLDRDWSFRPHVSAGSRVALGGVLGVVPEGPFQHRIMVPFGEPESVTVAWIGQGDLTSANRSLASAETTGLSAR